MTGATAAEQAPYDVREFRTADRSAYLDLHGDVFGSRPTRAWFDWKYTANPYADGVSIVVAERGDELVGARSLLALSLRTPDGDVDAYQPCDTMVHPDHRRRGLFTRMTERALDTYGDDGPTIAFNFPNEVSLGANLDLGWEPVADLPVYHRVQAPSALLGAVPRPFRAPLDAATTGWLGLLERVRTPDTASIAVERHEGVPAALLADVARPAPDRLHVPRDERFYAWRYARPDRRYATYVARRNGTVVGATVFATGGDGTRFMEFQPRCGRAEAVTTALVARALRDAGDVPLVSTLVDDVPTGLLAAFGFVGSDAPVLGRWFGTRPFVVRPFDTGATGWHLGDLDVRDPDSWLLGFGEMDVG